MAPVFSASSMLMTFVRISVFKRMFSFTSSSMHSTQRTAPVTCRIRQSRASMPRDTHRASTFTTTGTNGSAKAIDSRSGDSSSCAGRISEQ